MPEDGVIEGGSTNEGAPKPIKISPPVDVEKHRRDTTLFLLRLLASVIAGYIASVFVLEWNGKKTETVSHAFNTVLPVISGLTGSAVAYYFSRDSGSAARLTKIIKRGRDDGGK